MSLILGSTLAVALCPSSVGIVARRGRLRRTECIEVASVDGPTWLGPIETLRQWLAATPLGRGRVSFLLSSRFVRYALVEWPPTALNREEAAVWARTHLEAACGDMTGWTIVCDPGEYGHAYVACAVQEELLRALREAVISSRLSMGAITPAFVCSWNRWRKSVRPGNFFGMAESGRFVLGCLGARGWESLRVLSTTVSADSLVTLTRREHVLLGKLNPSVTLLHAPGVPLSLSNSSDVDEVRWIAPEGEDSSPSLALAKLAGV